MKTNTLAIAFLFLVAVASVNLADSPADVAVKPEAKSAKPKSISVADVESDDAAAKSADDADEKKDVQPAAKSDAKKSPDAENSDEKKSGEKAEDKESEVKEAADEKPAEEKTDEEKLLEGHSYHGEAFNEGPRQAAYLMGGTGNISFPIKSKKENVQAFINQGVGQLHGFWFFEAERSFRQAASIDPECAAAYWGMAMANTKNRDRAKEFSEQAMKYRDQETPRVKRYIEALDQLLKAKKSDKKSASKKYIKALEKIFYDHPEDIEALAFIALHMWEGRSSGLSITSHLAVNALIEQVLRANPQHPVHHYRIHLWDYEKPERALTSAAQCGQAAPSIAHMWHMPGHIYSRVKRYDDAVWQQEASARTDHAQMMRDQLLPDQIHNFAHNNEWLIRNLMFIGRVRDAMGLAMNMIELPRHPKFNVITKGNSSSSYGRTRLFQVLTQGELWDELIQLAETEYLQPTAEFNEQIKRQRLLGRALFQSGQYEVGVAMIGTLESRREQAVQDQTAAMDEAEKKARDKWAEEQAAKDSEKEAPKDSEKEDTKASESKDESKDPEKTDDATCEESADEKSSGDGEKKVEAEAKGQGEKSDESSKNEAIAKKADEAVDKNSDENAADQKSDATDEESKSEAAEETPNTDSDKLKKEIEKARKKVKKEHERKIKRIDSALSELRGHVDRKNGKHEEAYKKFKKAGTMDKWFLARARFEMGEVDEALKDLKDYTAKHKGEALPLAYLAELAWDADKLEMASEAFGKLQEISGNIDLSVGVFGRLAQIANECGCPEDWRQLKEPATDVGNRPSLDTLGPFRWQPPSASDWELHDHNGEMVSLSDYRGRPVVVIFYLGFGCLHCAEQLQAFSPQVKIFNKAGIEVMAVSTESQEQLKEALADFEGFPIRLLSNKNLDVFKKYRVHDDFENQPLHGTFLIDGDGRIRWHDISYEPFMDHKFVLEEATRLLSWD